MGVIFITGWCLEDLQAPTPCVHDEGVCADGKFETTEHDVVNLLQKPATVLQRQTEEFQVGSIGFRAANSGKLDVAKPIEIGGERYRIVQLPEAKGQGEEHGEGKGKGKGSGEGKGTGKLKR